MSRRFATAAIQATFTSNPPRLNAAVILNRSPFLTPTSTPFEAAYYAYQVKLARALSSPFHLPFYFKQGSLLHRRFRAEERQRNFEAWGATGKRKGLEDASDVEQVALSDSVHGSSTSSTPEKPKRAETVDDIPMEDDEFKPTPRESRADVSGDVKSLDRMGDRNLYLLLKTRKDGGVWTFPHGPVDASQPLHLSAQSELHRLCGPDMDTWIVGRHPIGVHRADSEPRTFFFKGHILAGQAHPDGNEVLDFAWFTKQEIRERVGNEYFDAVRDLLAGF